MANKYCFFDLKRIIKHNILVTREITLGFKNNIFFRKLSAVQLQFSVEQINFNRQDSGISLLRGCSCQLECHETSVPRYKFNLPKYETYKFSSYLTGNASRLRYKAEPVNAVYGNSRRLL
jgi:hypothetical protein